MKKKQEKTRIGPALEVEFTINEPVKPIPGGCVRESALLDRAKFPEVAKRERLNALLLTHCPSNRIEDHLQPEDEVLLHRICNETITCGTHPVIRQKAIWALRFYPTARTIGVLSDLAEFGEDEYIRSHAIRSLGTMKLSLALPLLVRKLRDHSDLVINAAEVAIREIVDELGEDVLATILRYERSVKMRERINSIVQVRRGVEQVSRQAIARKEAKQDDV
jgi:hypothetical protein